MTGKATSNITRNGVGGINYDSTIDSITDSKTLQKLGKTPVVGVAPIPAVFQPPLLAPVIPAVPGITSVP